MPRRLVLALLSALLLLISQPARAWIETHVTGDEIRLEIDRAGKAAITHRISLTTKGTERLRVLEVAGVDPDAAPLPNSYVVPARDAVSSALDSAIPLLLELKRPEAKSDEHEPPPVVLLAKVQGDKGLPRGAYVLVIRYQTDLRARELIVRDGAMLRLRWHGPIFPDGFDSAHTTFVVPSAPSPPLAVEPLDVEADEGGDTLPPTYLSELRRGTDTDELELMRSYAPEQKAILWSIRIDQRAFEPLPDKAAETEAPPPAAPETVLSRQQPVERMRLAVAGAVLFLLYLLLVVIKHRQVSRLAAEVGGMMPPMVPLPIWLRAPLAAAALVGGLSLQLVYREEVWGAGCVVLACLLAAHGAARLSQSRVMRGPGRWLVVSEAEALAPPPPPRGAWLDSSTRTGKLLLLLGALLVGAGAYFTALRSLYHGVMVGLDVVALLAIFGTGRLVALPPDPAVTPGCFLSRLVRRLRRKKAPVELRITPRIRIPDGAVDPDELRLMMSPRVPLRGFRGLEVGVCFALGLGARVALPQVMLRLVAGSPCDEATKAMARHGRIAPGRQPNERVVTFSPRLPTLAMTVKIVEAIAVRVTDRAPLQPRQAAAPRPVRRRSKQPRAAGRRAA